jgi:hypothetical protein
VNSEELEQSLRSEFETYLNTVLGDLKQESAEFQQKIQAEFDRHKAQFDEAYAALSARFDVSSGAKEAFDSTVSEHLKLARDEGAKIAANAMVEAEKFEERTPVHAAPAPPPARYDTVRDAVNDISSKDSQSAILKALVQHAGEFAPRGAFFIIKSGHFAGWKVFGTDEDMEQAIREIHFPIAKDTILSQAITSLSTVEANSGDHADNASFLDPLSFGSAGQMKAFPLVARGRGVAVLYVDSGDGEAEINSDALETIIKVAGLTVELLASTQTAAEENRTMGAADFENARHEQTDTSSDHGGSNDAYSVPIREVPSPTQPAGFSFTESVPAGAEYQAEPFVEPAAEYETPYQGSGEPSYSQPDNYFQSSSPGVEAELRGASGDPGTAPDTFSFEQPAFGTEQQAQTPPAYNYSFERTSGDEDTSQSSSSNVATPETNTFEQPSFGRSAADFDQPAAGGFNRSAPEFGQPASEARESSSEPGRFAPEFGQARSESGMSAQEVGQQAPEPNSFVADFGLPSQEPAPPARDFGRPAAEFNRAPEFGQPAPEFGQPGSGYGQTADEYRQPASQQGGQSEARSPSPFDADPAPAASPFQSPFDRAVEEYRPSAASAPSFTPAPQPVVPAPAVSAPQGRLSDRPVDLPIEVPDDERRLHNDARRFARLLVSEIKLYNEKKVIEGKQSHDLYERLKEAIDRSREMYDKRVQPPVAAKFDYFHYELLNSLAEGDVERLGAGYPGSKV